MDAFDCTEGGNVFHWLQFYGMKCDEMNMSTYGWQQILITRKLFLILPFTIYSVFCRESSKQYVRWMSWVRYHPSMVLWNHLDRFLVMFSGVFLRRLIRETVHLLVGCCGLWRVVCVCWHEVLFLGVQTGPWVRCAMLELRRTEGHRLSSWEFLFDKFEIILCWMVCCSPITPNWLKYCYIYCDVFDWRPSLNTPMHTRESSTVGSDTLTTPVLLVTIATKSRKVIVGRIATNSRKANVGCLATNSRKARFSIGQSKCYIKKATEKLVSLRQSASEVSLCQLVSENRRVQRSQWIIEGGSQCLEEFQ
jgi:hypothetical protein